MGPADFGHWFAGFVDGEGCFIINRKRAVSGATYYDCTFRLILRDDDEAILREIAAWAGIGRLGVRSGRRQSRADNPQAMWLVCSLDDAQQLVEIFERYPLRARKAADLRVWRLAVAELAHVRRLPRPRRDWSRMAALKTQLEAGRRYPPLAVAA